MSVEELMRVEFCTTGTMCGEDRPGHATPSHHKSRLLMHQSLQEHSHWTARAVARQLGARRARGVAGGRGARDAPAWWDVDAVLSWINRRGVQFPTAQKI